MSAVATERFIDLYPVQHDFVLDDHRYSAFIGGRNCVAGDTMIEGVPIAEINSPSVVSTLLGPSEATPSFRKGRTNLYRVRTQSGAVVVVAPGHRFLTPNGWRQLDRLSVGDVIAADGSESARSAFGRSRGWPGHCFPGSRQHGELSNQREAGGLNKSRRPRTIDGDTIPLATSRLSSSDASLAQRHRSDASRPWFAVGVGLPLDQHQTLDLTPVLSHLRDTSPQLRPSATDEPARDPSSPFGFPALGESSILWTESSQAVQRLIADCLTLGMSIEQVRSRDCASSCVDYTAFWDEISDITFTKEGDYYDITVPNTGHYSAHGLYHHNSGKTYAGSWKAANKASEGGLGCIAAPSFPMLEHGAKAQFLARLDEHNIPYTKTRDSITIPMWDAEVIFVTLESESRVRGPNYAWGWADEVEYVTDRSIWRAFKGAVRDGGNPQLFVTSTPKGRRLVWDEWVVGKTAHHALYKATTFDNPFIDAEDYVAGLGYAGVFYEQEITADFVTFEGLVYPGFDRSRHVQVVGCDTWATVLGLDVGTRNPTSISTYRHAGERLHKEREVYQRGMSSDDITDAVEAEFKRSKASHVVIDPSAAGLSKSLVERGVRVRPGVNDILIGISRVSSILSTFSVDPSCVNTIAEFESYAYPEGAKADKDVPLKANDHAMDELRYVVLDLYGKPRPKAVPARAQTQESRWG